MIIRQEYGTVGASGRISTITSAKGIPALFLNPPRDAEFIVPFSSGGTHEVVVGDKLTGGTSSATAYVTGIVLESGTWAGGDAAGMFFLKTKTGTFQAENLNEGANSNVCTIAEDLIEFIYAGMTPKSIQVVVETAAIKFLTSGVKPTASAGTDLGIEMTAGQNTIISGGENIRKFLCINETASNGAVVTYQVFY